MNLRDFLLSSLKTLPGTREFHLHVLVSSPRKHSGLYPFAHPRPRTYLQDILILLSEQATPDSPRILVVAIEASVYNIPSTSCGLLYISKVDTTGQSIAPSPAAVLVRSLTTFYGDPETRPIAVDHVWVHLFARAQGQYLFPNSSEYSGKRPLSDVKLCAWWKRLLTEVADELERRIDLKAEKKKIKLYYVLPGYSELEAVNSLRVVSSSSVQAQGSGAMWTYGHPYTQTDIPLPCPACGSGTSGQHNLGHYIPSFDDDPKSRFMDEIAYTPDADGVRSPKPKRPRISHEGAPSNAKAAAVVDEKGGKGEDEVLGELGTVTADEFWERMSFRQECVAGAVTGFFTMVASTGNDPSRSEKSPLAPAVGQVSCQMNKRIMSSLLTGVEFSTLERSIRATETLEGAIRGLCEDLAGPSRPSARSRTGETDSRRTPEREVLLAPPSTPPRRQRQAPEVSPNPFPEPVASLETYHAHIYGSVFVKNAALSVQGSSGTEVTVLTARKKKKRCD